MKHTKVWIIILALLFTISVTASVAVYCWHGIGHTVSIYHQGKLIDKIHLDTVTTPYDFTIASESGGFNVISVEQGRICVSEASCPDHVCINTGWLSDGAIPIVCLPNELVIQVDTNTDIDASAQ